MVALAVLDTLIALSRRQVEIESVAIALLGVVVAFVGYAVLSRGRAQLADGEAGGVGLGIGAAVLAAGLAALIWTLVQDWGAVVTVVAGAVGVAAYLYGLYLSQNDDDRREVAHAFKLLEEAAAEGVAREHAAVNRRTFTRWFSELGLLHIVAIIAVVYAVFPIMYVISASLNSGGTLTGSNELFRTIETGNFEALSSTRFWDWFVNSLQVGVITSVTTVLMGAAAAYAFSRYRFKGRRMGLMSLLIIQMFPQILAFVAIFLLLMTLGFVWSPIGLNSKFALVLVYLGGALGANTFLMYGFFNTVPRELDEAAKIDGATHAQIYWTIILRLVAPILAVVGLLSFIGTFNDFVLAKVILQSEGNWTLAVGMYQWVSDEMSKNWGQFAAGSVLGSIPILILFLTLQRYIVGGLTAGSVKG
nr:sugar ABC transporter permease [Actinomycetales bacterium]